jgi:hypothetical protein
VVVTVLRVVTVVPPAGMKFMNGPTDFLTQAHQSAT